MILEYLYKNNAWGKQRKHYIFDVTNRKIYYSDKKEDSDENEDFEKIPLIALIEKHEQEEMLMELRNLSNSPNDFTYKYYHNSFDAGSEKYFLTLNSMSSKIILGEKGDYVQESNNPQVQNLVNLIDKYVQIVNDTCLKKK